MYNQQLVTILSLLLGFITASTAEWLRDRRTSARELEARKAARQELRFERRVTFQRETLLELQEETLKLTRATGEMHHADLMALRAGGEWQKQKYGEELNGRAHTANVRTLMLGVRVRDESVRRLLDEVRSLCISATLCPSKDQGELAMGSMSVALDNLNRRIGEVLRSLDDDEVSP